MLESTHINLLYTESSLSSLRQNLGWFIEKKITEKVENRTGHQECTSGAEDGGFSFGSPSGVATLGPVTVLHQDAV